MNDVGHNSDETHQRKRSWGSWLADVLFCGLEPVVWMVTGVLRLIALFIAAITSSCS